MSRTNLNSRIIRYPARATRKPAAPPTASERLMRDLRAYIEKAADPAFGTLERTSTSTSPRDQEKYVLTVPLGVRITATRTENPTIVPYYHLTFETVDPHGWQRYNIENIGYFKTRTIFKALKEANSQRLAALVRQSVID